MKIEDRKMLTDVYKEITATKVDVQWIKKALDGNGKKGLIQEVRENTYWRYGVTSAITIIVVVIGWVLTVIF